MERTFIRSACCLLACFSGAQRVPGSLQFIFWAPASSTKKRQTSLVRVRVSASSGFHSRPLTPPHRRTEDRCLFPCLVTVVGLHHSSLRPLDWVSSERAEQLRRAELSMTKVLLLGLGRWGVNHLRNLNAMPVELYVAEVDTRRLEAARKLGLPETRLTTNYRDLVEKMDCVIVVTPAQTHFSICKEFLEADKDVFVEKPITLISREARQLTELAEKRKRILQVGHIFRFDPASEWLREAIQAGQFGRLQILRSNFSGFKRPRNDSGVMLADAIHFVDLFNYFIGKTPARVLAATHDFMQRGMEDASLLSLEYQNDAGTIWATIETNYFLPGKFRE